MISIICECISNNSYIQNFFQKVGLDELYIEISKENDIILKQKYIKILSTIIKGNNLELKRSFIDKNGITWIINIALKEDDFCILERTLMLL